MLKHIHPFGVPQQLPGVEGVLLGGIFTFERGSVTLMKGEARGYTSIDAFLEQVRHPCLTGTTEILADGEAAAGVVIVNDILKEWRERTAFDYFWHISV